MKQPMKRRGFLGWTLVAAAGMGPWLAGGCGLRQAPLSVRTYLMRTPAVGAGAGGGDGVGGGGAGVLLVRPFKVASAFDSRSFVVRASEGEYRVDAYHAWLTSPGAMLTEVMADWVRGLGVFGAVTTGGSQLVATHALEGEITEWYGDYRDGASPKAVVAGQLRMLHPLKGGATGVLWRRTVRSEVVMERGGAEALVAGWEEGVGRWCRELEGLLRGVGDGPLTTG